MGNVLDRIEKYLLIRSAEIADNTFKSDEGNIDRMEGPFSIQMNYENLSGGITVLLEVSVDGITFVPLEQSEMDLVDPSGTHIFDVSSTGISKLRVAFTGGGSLQVNTMILVGSRRH